MGNSFDEQHKMISIIKIFFPSISLISNQLIWYDKHKYIVHYYWLLQLNSFTNTDWTNLPKERDDCKFPEETSVYALNFDPAICESCDTCDCLMRCQYMTFDLEEAKREKANINNGKDSRVLTGCATCYALCCGGGEWKAKRSPMLNLL